MISTGLELTTHWNIQQHFPTLNLTKLKLQYEYLKKFYWRAIPSVHFNLEMKWNCWWHKFTLTRYENATLNFKASFQWNRNGETGTQLPKLLSHLLRILKSKHLYDFIKKCHSGSFCFTLGWMKNVFWNEMIKLRRQFVQSDDTRKNIFQNLQQLLGSTLTSTEKPHFCCFKERN